MYPKTIIDNCQESVIGASALPPSRLQPGPSVSGVNQGQIKVVRPKKKLLPALFLLRLLVNINKTIRIGHLYLQQTLGIQHCVPSDDFIQIK